MWPLVAAPGVSRPQPRLCEAAVGQSVRISALAARRKVEKNTDFYCSFSICYKPSKAAFVLIQPFISSPSCLGRSKPLITSTNRSQPPLRFPLPPPFPFSRSQPPPTAPILVLPLPSSPSSSHSSHPLLASLRLPHPFFCILLFLLLRVE